MTESTIYIEYLNGQSPIFKATEFSSGYDVSANESKALEPFQPTVVSLGFKLKMPPHLEAQIRSRSGLALNNNIIVLNSPGTIDSDYRGEVKVILMNFGDKIFVIERGMRIAQIVFSRIEKICILNEKIIDDTKRGLMGFGSTLI